MLTLPSLCAAVFISAVAAQNVVQITVGGDPTNPFIFTPPNVTASTGDTVMFTFAGAPGNHSVTQSTFTAPCDPSGSGFDSGNILIPQGTTAGFPTWNLTITNGSEPIWFFCKQLIPQAHCNFGMVGSINAPASGSNTFDAFVAAAMQHTGNSGQSIGFLVGEGASASAVPGPFSGSITGFGLPSASATAPAGGSSAGGSSGASPAATSASSANGLRVSGMMALMAVMLGFAIA